MSEICYIIQRHNSYNLMTDKVAESVPWTIYRPDEKGIKVPESWKLTFYKGQYFKPSNLNLASVSEHAGKNIVEFADSTHTIYWSTNIAKQVANSWKQSKKYIIYRPLKH